MKLLDLEFRRAIKDMPENAISELKEEAVFATTYTEHNVNTDSLKRIIDVTRQRYGLGPTIEIDDNKAIQDIENKAERDMQMSRREKGIPVRRISVDSIKAIAHKEIVMRDVAKYAETLKTMSMEEIYATRKSMLREMREQPELTGREIDEKYDVNVYDKLYALNDAEAVLVLREAFSKCPEDDFKQKKSKIEGIERNDEIYDAPSEIRKVLKILGIECSLDAQLGMTMADVAEAIETREKELLKNKGIKMTSIPIANVQKDDLTNARNNERGLRAPIENRKEAEQDGK